MGREQALEPMIPFPGNSRRLVDPEVGRGVVRHAHGCGVRRDLLERAGQAWWIPGEHGALRVGQVFPAARHRHLDDLGDDRSEERQDQPHSGQDGERVAAFPAVAPAAPAPERPSAPPEPPQHELGDQHHRADQRRHDGSQEDVAIPHVAHLVADHALQLDAVHGVEESLGHGDRGVLGVGSRGEGVGGLFGNDVDGRLGDARGDGQPLHYVVEARLFLLADRPGAGGTKDEPVAIAVGVKGHPPGDQQRHHQPDRPRPQQQAEQVAEPAHVHERPQDDQNGAALVAGDLLVQGVLRSEPSPDPGRALRCRRTPGAGTSRGTPRSETGSSG